jgi:hypothetical protein
MVDILGLATALRAATTIIKIVFVFVFVLQQKPRPKVKQPRMEFAFQSNKQKQKNKARATNFAALPKSSAKTKRSKPKGPTIKQINRRSNRTTRGTASNYQAAEPRCSAGWAGDERAALIVVLVFHAEVIHVAR